MPADISRLVALCRVQARACGELGSPFYATLLERVADDVAAGGPAATVLAGHESDPTQSVLSLRLMGGVHRLVLERRAPILATSYPSVGGTGDPDAAWPASEPDRAPRAAAGRLRGGAAHAGRRRAGERGDLPAPPGARPGNHRLRTWPGDGAAPTDRMGRVLGTASPHGPPVTWE